MHIAIDGNEANTTNRVGSNVYAFELLQALHKRIHADKNHQVSVLLAEGQVNDMPPATQSWRYVVVGPQKFWTQWALPNYLFKHRAEFDVFFTPGHYAPRMCPVPYVSSVMDLAFLEFPDHFKKKDYLQLKLWTRYSAQRATHVIAISESTKHALMSHYAIPEDKISIAYPALSDNVVATVDKKKRADFFSKHTIKQPYILFVGTLQPRKNIPVLVKAFELFSEKLTQKALTTKQKLRYSKLNATPQLVLAGKTGWLSESSVQAIANSPLADRILQTGFVSDSEKSLLYSGANATVLVGLLEGFGLPPLESLAHGTPVVVSNTSSLPEVVGAVGSTVNPTDPESIAEALLKLYTLPPKARKKLAQKARAQAASFSWDASANTVLQVLEDIHNE